METIQPREDDQREDANNRLAGDDVASASATTAVGRLLLRRMKEEVRLRLGSGQR